MEKTQVLKAILAKHASQYKHVRALGAGGFAHVHLVHHTIFKEDHALKIMDSDFLLKRLEKGSMQTYKDDYNQLKERFLNEARFYKRITHPNIVDIHDVDVFVDQDGDIETPYIFMKFVKGKSLEKIIRAEAPLSLKKTTKISKGILQALNTIHEQGIIHRDITPKNVIIEPGEGNAVLIDFGLAKDTLNDAKLTSSGYTLGTPLYMSPEQFSGLKDLKSTTDIYSFGIILYEMATGEVPFPGKNLLEIMNGHLMEPIPDGRKENSHLPETIFEVIEKALEKIPEDRAQASTLLELLENIDFEVGQDFEAPQIFIKAFEKHGDVLKYPISSVEEKRLGELVFYRQQFAGSYPECYYFLVLEANKQEVFCIKHGMGKYYIQKKHEEHIGIPISNEYLVVSSTGVPAALQHFKIGNKPWERRRVYYHLEGELADKAFYVKGGINRYYEMIGAEKSHLGLPVDNSKSTDYGSVVQFEKGHMQRFKETNSFRIEPVVPNINPFLAVLDYLSKNTTDIGVKKEWVAGANFFDWAGTLSHEELKKIKTAITSLGIGGQTVPGSDKSVEEWLEMLINVDTG